MKMKRFNEEQIIRILHEQESGITTAEICRKHGIAKSTFYKWKSKYGGMDVSDARRLKALEDENRRLKSLLADAHLDISMLKSITAKKW
jgi:putative transposase